MESGGTAGITPPSGRVPAGMAWRLSTAGVCWSVVQTPLVGLASIIADPTIFLPSGSVGSRRPATVIALRNDADMLSARIDSFERSVLPGGVYFSTPTVSPF